MKRIHSIHFVLLSALLLGAASAAPGAVTTFTNRAAWESAVNNDYTTIDFTGFEFGTVITTQYQHLGVTFVDGNDYVQGPGFIVYPEDGWGLHGGSNHKITVDFDTAQSHFAVNYPGDLIYRIFAGGTQLATGTPFSSGAGLFYGVVSTQPFDRLEIERAGSGVVSIDNLYFGIPAPGALGVFGLAALVGGGRRRRAG